MPVPVTQFAALLSERDRQVLAASGHGRPGELRTPGALLVVDLTHDFIGDRPEDILESVKRYPLSCGAAGWAAAERTASLLTAARASRVPIFYTVRSAALGQLEQHTFGRKRTTASRTRLSASDEAMQLPPIIAPAAGDVVIPKAKPSAFFGTPLVEFLITLGVRQLLCCGATTSGCVRATVVDGFSYGFSVAVVEDCVADRWDTAHRMSLFDMAGKYADVLTSGEALDYLGSHPAHVSSNDG